MGKHIEYPANLGDGGAQIQQMAQKMISEMDMIFGELDTLFAATPAPLTEAMSDWYGQVRLDVMEMSSYWYQIGTNVIQAAQAAAEVEQQLAQKINLL